MERRDPLVRYENKEDLCWSIDKVVAFCEKAGYSFEFVENKFYGLPFEVNEMICKEGVKDYMSSITSFKPRDYQVDAVHDTEI